MAEEKMADQESVEEETVEETVEKEENEEEKEEITVEEQLKALEEEVNTWKTDYYKVFADMENLKKRLQNEHANAMKFMMQSFIEQLLPVVDNFERSLAVENPSDEIKNFLKGYEMIYNQLMQVLQSQGVEVIKTEGQEFDPNFHQAVMTVKDDNFKSNMIVEELQKGYMLKDRVIRASLVKVSE
ncbi:nucleotide exchange factor GrpE [Thomasclavelia saccharogumia]|uniref:nucleotide exchange factor GrpE n=1 Tax=Thomasclavelia saccharogumia TaxID=341225 RepID=UPI00047CADBB|nr:nucleotide exchange factor GrpE [Thomasclavelia saccharogumia]